MEDRILVCEKTGQRYKVSPTVGSSVHLRPIGLDRKPKGGHSNVAEKLGRLRIELNAKIRKVSELSRDIELEQTKARIFRSALSVRKVYIECPECGNPIQAGDRHKSYCRHFKAEQHM